MDRTDSRTSFATATSQPDWVAAPPPVSGVSQIGEGSSPRPKEGPTCTFAGIPLGESLAQPKRLIILRNKFSDKVFRLSARFSIFKLQYGVVPDGYLMDGLAHLSSNSTRDWLTSA